MPEVTSHLVIAPALLLPDPPIDRLRTYHLFPLQPEPAADLLRTVLAVDDEPSHGPLHLVGELQVVSPGLYLVTVKIQWTKQKKKNSKDNKPNRGSLINS